MKPQSRLLFLAVLAALPTLALADEAADALDPILVTATRTPIALQDSIAPAQVIDREQIEASQATSLQELLAGRAGINLTNAGGLGKQTSLFLRGTNSSHTVVLVDGVRINSADLNLAMFQDLPLAQIERIEIVRGPQSSLYGADAIGGVIQIFTRRNAGSFAPHFQLGGGSNGLRQASGGIGGSGRNGWFGADIAYQHSDGIDACRGSATLFTGCFADEPDRDGYRNLSKSLRGGYSFNEQWTVEGSALRADGENHYDGYYNYSETRQQVLAGKVRYTPSERLALTANVGRSDNESDNFGDFGVRGSAQTHRDSASLQADIGVADGQLLSTGVDWSQDNLDGSSAGYLVDSRRNTGVFVQYQARFGRHQLQASARNDDNQQFGNHATGSLGWALELGHGLRVNASYGTAFKAPTFSDLYDPWSGVPTLDPEKSKSANIGVSQHAQGWHWGLDVYETRIDDLITYDATTFMMQQVEKARIRGAELTAGAVLAGFDINAQLSFTDPRNRTAGSGQFDNWLARRAQQTARLDVDRRFGDFRAGLTVQGAGKRFDDADNAVKLGGYGLLDLRAEYALTPAWSVLARVANVFDRQYETIAWFNQPGREYQLSVRYQPK
ncbi:TonB-dependent vitamin B12 receptor [Stenotrophomonas sp. YAU14D1_LEIMI4_1]|uniref:TonB-dependent vitamin B12 receptor n=1 Tax=Stenotrophomonas sp. YAU14D1_LEIMI4_1 TaxID=2072407 RepID=UPI000D53C4EF|nr:TonB-dependent vitamin B12 receptor [Stenotrophomonas sp. YAU14D1_LEIMI4_1]AWH24102.1 TonB-dependent vitamin B12 receptor [Stenotrophomonas sp. YAU14D1_LEIMI4_1]